MAQLTVGESIDIELSIANATAAEVRLGGAGTGTHTMVSVLASWIISIDSATFQAGNYFYEVWATYTGGKKKIVERGEFTLRPALREADLRTQARKSLDAIDAMLAGQANEGVRRYKINNRELERYDVNELLTLRQHFARLVIAEQRQNAGKTGPGPRIAVRF